MRYSFKININNPISDTKNFQFQTKIENGKFEDDHIFVKNENYICYLSGVILNKNNLTQTKGLSWSEAFINLYEEKGEVFFTIFKGTFNGFLFDKQKDKWIIFSNFQGELPIFYSTLEYGFILSSHVSEIKPLLPNQKLSLNIHAAYMLLTYGWMLENFTLYNEVKRLKAGTYLCIQGGKIEEKEYEFFKTNNIPKQSENDIIENLDVIFRRNIQDQFNKDKENGYRHLVNLSGGLDSRMTSWVANELGFSDQVNLTFAQTNSGDETIAKEIAAYLKNEWLFKSLDNGIFLKRIEEATKISEGNSSYQGIAHGKSAFDLLNFNHFGIRHTGQSGGIITATKYKHAEQTNKFHGALSTKLTQRLPDGIIDFKKYPNHELFLFSNRIVNGLNYGLVGMRETSFTLSPFYEKEFWNYCYSIPRELRYNHNIYKKWIIKKYPGAAEFIWDKTKVRVKYNFWKDKKLFHRGKGTDIQSLLNGFYRRYARKLNLPYKPSLNAMNPYESWLEVNENLQQFIHNYFTEHIHLLEPYSDLKKDAEDLFKKGIATEKLQVLSLLASVKLFIHN